MLHWLTFCVWWLFSRRQCSIYRLHTHTDTHTQHIRREILMKIEKNEDEVKCEQFVWKNPNMSKYDYCILNLFHLCIANKRKFEWKIKSDKKTETNKFRENVKLVSMGVLSISGNLWHGVVGEWFLTHEENYGCSVFTVQFVYSVWRKFCCEYFEKCKFANYDDGSIVDVRRFTTKNPNIYIWNPTLKS